MFNLVRAGVGVAVAVVSYGVLKYQSMVAAELEAVAEEAELLMQEAGPITATTMLATLEKMKKRIERKTDDPALRESMVNAATEATASLLAAKIRKDHGMESAVEKTETPAAPKKSWLAATSSRVASSSSRTRKRDVPARDFGMDAPVVAGEAVVTDYRDPPADPLSKLVSKAADAVAAAAAAKAEAAKAAAARIADEAKEAEAATEAAAEAVAVIPAASEVVEEPSARDVMMATIEEIAEAEAEEAAAAAKKAAKKNGKPRNNPFAQV